MAWPNAQELHHYLFATVGLRRKKEEVLSQLPPKRRQTIRLRESALTEPATELRDLESKLFSNAA